MSNHGPTMITSTLPLKKPTAHITSYGWGSEHRLMVADVPLPSSSHARPIQISLDTFLSSCGGTYCRLRKISSRLWLTFHDSSCCSDFQISRRNIIACAQDNGFSGCFDTTLCFPTCLVVSLAYEFRIQSAQNPSEKHLACVKSPVFLARLRPCSNP